MHILAGAFILAIIGIFGFLGVEWFSAESRDVQVTVLEKLYEAQRTGVGVGSGSNGGSAVVVTSSGPEYDLMVEFRDGSRDIVSTNKETLLAVNEGEETTLSCMFGGITDSILMCRL